MPDINDFYDYKNSSGGSGNNNGSDGGGGFGCGWVVIVIVVIMLIYFIFSGTSWDAIDSLLAFGFLAFLFARTLFR